MLLNVISGICTTDCPCKDIGNNNTVCQFDRDVDRNITADVFFDSPVEYIPSLRLEFNSTLKDGSLRFPFTAIFQLVFKLLSDFCDVSDLNINELSTFIIDDIEELSNLISLFML
ncbi:hypothetical protein CHS0354_019588 [Potamilus streckersoni]|uniref:Uncharacterized protein n=1 Tax=Potamilus streckersoni TaxID=2493646 RepID=A0AAE0TGJ5_9BIVA|nr:hypothetical protein CHS0354_019588 [Potamilus streckersoni]